jgi:hypothetical protein
LGSCSTVRTFCQCRTLFINAPSNAPTPLARLHFPICPHYNSNPASRQPPEQTGSSGRLFVLRVDLHTQLANLENVFNLQRAHKQTLSSHSTAWSFHCSPSIPRQNHNAPSLGRPRRTRLYLAMRMSLLKVKYRFGTQLEIGGTSSGTRECRSQKIRKWGYGSISTLLVIIISFTFLA